MDDALFGGNRQALEGRRAGARDHGPARQRREAGQRHDPRAIPVRRHSDADEELGRHRPLERLPTILSSAAYAHGVVFITWDEGEGNDGRIGLITLSPFARSGYSNQIPYTHSSTLRTLQEIFGMTTWLGDAANATDLSDLFVAPGGNAPQAASASAVAATARPGGR